MLDPHVVSLHYLLETEKTMQFNNPPPLEGDEPEFSYRLADSKLTVTMKAHFPTEEAARNCVEPFLRSWEIDVAIRYTAREMTFRFENSQIIDRVPPLADGQKRTVLIAGTIHVKVTCHPAAMTLTHAKYPAPPKGFRASADVENMWFRYARHRDDREPLLSMAYFCLTVIEGSTGLKGNEGARKAAAKKYSVDIAILRQLGELVSAKGGPAEARKLDAGATLVELTDQERRWIGDAVRLLMRRKGEYDADPTASLPQLTMADVK
jgi:hypothetical protein